MSDIVTIFPPRAKAITPHDTNPLVDYVGASTVMQVFCAVGGTITVQPSGNPAATTVQFTVPSGGSVPVSCSLVKATGTSATGIVGVW